MAGYSGTPLPRKLGLKEGHPVALVGAPPGFRPTLGKLPDDATLRADLRGRGACDGILFFARRRAELERRVTALAGRLAPAGGLWGAWLKKSSGVATDLSDSVVREIGLASGLVDNKVCAVDEAWSALRFVVRLRDR